MSLNFWLNSHKTAGWRTLLISALALAALAIMSACTVTNASDTATTAGTGNLTVNWTIASGSPATGCSARGAQTISIQVFNANGLQAANTTASCTASSATINALPVGSYTLQAELLDLDGGALASLGSAVATSVDDQATTTVSVDFPAAAFTMPVAGTGTLEIDWTIAGLADGPLCATHSAQTISIQVFRGNAPYGAASTTACSALGSTIVGLPAGAYTIEAQLLDVNGASVTTLVGPLPETITDGVLTKQALDFPETSFTPVTNNPNAGSLTVTWTVAGTATATSCAAANAANIVLQLFDSANVAVGTAQTTACSTFTSTLVNVTPGTFTLTAKLVDANNADVTTTATVPNIVINAASATAQPLDFPSTSFLTSTTGTGSISVNWTIAGATDPASCAAHSATSISLQLYQSGGVTPIGSAILDPCTAFATTITNLAPGSYALSAQLVNSSSTVSSLIPPQPITVTAGESATQAFEFPTNAF